MQISTSEIVSDGLTCSLYSRPCNFPQTQAYLHCRIAASFYNLGLTIKQINMVLKTEKEAALLAASKKFDQALSRYDLSPFHDLLAEDVVLHQDAVTLFYDLHGRNAVIGYFQARPRLRDQDGLRTTSRVTLFRIVRMT
jgi:hypothetical protein